MSQCLLQLLDLQKVPLHSRAWIVDVVRVRLVHFMAKAGYVKELVLQDWRIDNEGELRAFPELILPELIDTLKCTHAVTSIKVSANYNVTLPLPLWEWITTKDLAKFKIGDLLAPPPGCKLHSPTDPDGLQVDSRWTPGGLQVDST